MHRFSTTRLPVTAMAAFIMTATSACASLNAGTYQDAVARWRLGDTQGALSAATRFYHRVRDDNGIPQAAVATAAQTALDTLEELPVLTRPTGPRSPLTPEDSRGGDSSALITELRRNLLSSRVTDVMKALSIARDFALSGEYPAILAVVYRRQALKADGGVLTDASLALRSLAPKWAALSLLSTWARGAVNSLTPPAAR